MTQNERRDVGVPASQESARNETVLVRPGADADIEAVREIFVEVYERDYPHKRFFDENWLRRSVYSDEILMLVAEDIKTGRLLGTASIVLDIGSHSDLIGEFGRLVVRPEARGRGIGQLLMRGRLEHAEPRLHVALVEARTAHVFSQKIALRHGFFPVGYLPQKHRLKQAESVALLARYFGAALELRRNNPRAVPEVKPLAHRVLVRAGLPDDVIVDEASQPYPEGGEFETEALTAAGLPPLLRIERGRTQGREVFGPTTLQQGFFKIRASESDYLIARRLGTEDVAGAIGTTHDALEDTLRINELVYSDELAVRYLLHTTLLRAEALGVRYVELDVSADAARLQRTLIELGFVPAAYIPAMVFADVERLDVVRFVYLQPSDDVVQPQLESEAAPIAQHVLSDFSKSYVLPKLKQAFERLAPFEGLSHEQAQRVACACRLRHFADGQELFAQGERPEGLFVVLEGEVSIERDQRRVGVVAAGELLGEFSAISGQERAASGTARGSVTTAFLDRESIQALTRRRPDIGVVMYRNIALGLGKKLRELDKTLGQV